jgi:hypothetical protein
MLSVFRRDSFDLAFGFGVVMTQAVKSIASQFLQSAVEVFVYPVSNNSPFHVVTTTTTTCFL